MAITRVIATLPYFSGVPEDVASNVFYFSTVAPITGTNASAIQTRLNAFYNAVDVLLSPILNSVVGSYRFYDMADPTPRTPLFTLPMAALTTGASGTAEEVSICLSYRAAAVSGEPAGRRRGRIYLGPLSAASVTAATSGTYSNLSSSNRDIVANAAAVLADQSEAEQWCVFSEADQIARQIVAGWVDNSFDTQRRRGRIATARTTWNGQP